MKNNLNHKVNHVIQLSMTKLAEYDPISNPSPNMVRLSIYMPEDVKKKLKTFAKQNKLSINLASLHILVRFFKGKK